MLCLLTTWCIFFRPYHVKTPYQVSKICPAMVWSYIKYTREIWRS